MREAVKQAREALRGLSAASPATVLQRAEAHIARQQRELAHMHARCAALSRQLNQALRDR